MSTRRTVSTVSLGATAAAVATGALLAVGPGLPAAPAEQAAAHPSVNGPLVAARSGGLATFRSCEDLRRWYVRAALPLVGPWGLGGPPEGEVGGGGPVPLAARDMAIEPVSSSPTGTNVQVPGVDESDVAKTDGRLLVRIAGNDLVVTDVIGDRPRELSRTSLPGPRLVHPELLLDGTDVVVLGNEEPRFQIRPMEGARTFVAPPQRETHAHLLSFDLSDPSTPRFTGDRVVDGGVASARQYADGTVRVVVTTGFPPLPFVRPGAAVSPEQAAQENQRVVESATAADWLPGIRTSADHARRPLLDCTQVRHPRAHELGTVSVLTFEPGDPGGLAATAVTGAGDLVYSSASRLYVATGRGSHTDVHAFALGGRRTTYSASGSVPGVARDRWSLDEYGGRLRVATAIGDPWSPRDNAVTVLEQRNGRLAVVGRLRGLGRGESLQSVRWFGSTAVVVTFRQTDPLWTLDLADPTAPRVLGSLRVPGYSAYLHPLGDALLVGIGRDVSPTSGADLGAQVATFDLARPDRVRRLDSYRFGSYTDAGAALEPRAFTYLPDRRVLLTPLQSQVGDGGRFVALRVGRDGSLRPAGSWVSRRYAGEDLRVLPLGGGRVALVGDVIRVVHVR
jgi:hypothetical protein